MASEENKMGRRNIGAIQNNIIKDTEFAAKVMAHGLDVLNLNPNGSKPQSPEELTNRFIAYFDLCTKNQIPPNNEGLALVSGYERKSFYEISQGVFRAEFTPIIKRAKDYIAMYDATLAQSGKIPSPVYIFRAKNFLGMKDTQDVQITPNVNQNVPEDAEEIIKKLPEKS